MAQYRSFLFSSGQQKGLKADGQPCRRGFTPEKIKEVLDQGGKLNLADALFCRVRYFCDGAVLGSRSFVDRVFQTRRDWFGKNRTTGARPLKEIDAPGLFVARALRVRPVG